MDRSRRHSTRHRVELGSWEIVRRESHPALREYVRGYVGFNESMARTVTRRELPSGSAVLIVNFGSPFRLTDPRHPSAVLEPPEGFLAGLTDSYILTESDGQAQCIQVNLTPLGLHHIIRTPMSEVTNRMIGFGEVFGAAGYRLAQQLHGAPDWERRFEYVEAFLAARLEQARSPSVGVAWACKRLEESAGRTSIRTLSEEIGCSPRHLIAQFREQVGLPPKIYSRILRFERAIRLLEQADGIGWAEIALESGYYDQAHLIRDFRELAGCAPSELFGRRPIKGGDVEGD